MRGFRAMWLAVALAACVPPQQPPPPSPQRDYEAEKRREREAAWAGVDAFTARQAKEREDKAAAEELARAADCASDRPAREAEMLKRLESRAHKDELVAWEADHCAVVDRSRAVVRVGQDSTGEWHAYEGRDRGVDRECDAKKPPEIEAMSARNLQIYEMPAQVRSRNRACQSADVSASDVARAYWARPVRER